jgi:hypothetical protein
VFTDFGWDILERLQAAGFARVQAEFHADPTVERTGALHVVFRAGTALLNGMQ